MNGFQIIGKVSINEIKDHARNGTKRVIGCSKHKMICKQKKDETYVYDGDFSEIWECNNCRSTYKVLE